MQTRQIFILRLALALVWLGTALVSALYPLQDNLALLARLGLHGEMALLALYGGIALDTLFGVLTLLYQRRWLWQAQAGLILLYSALIAFCLPEYYLHPFGPLLKNLPILAILYVLIQTQEPT